MELLVAHEAPRAPLEIAVSAVEGGECLERVLLESAREFLVDLAGANARLQLRVALDLWHAQRDVGAIERVVVVASSLKAWRNGEVLSKLVTPKRGTRGRARSA